MRYYVNSNKLRALGGRTDLKALLFQPSNIYIYEAEPD
jgi:hypothetical protein